MTNLQQNHPQIWLDKFPFKAGDCHKYHHGHALIYAAPQMSGATNLAASACARAGAGLVSVIAPADRCDLYRAILPAHIIVRDSFDTSDARITARLYGSGGMHQPIDFTHHLPTILDADALHNLPDQLSPHYILTPHQGEFDHAFAKINGTRAERALAAAKSMNCYIVLKGSETLIASPDGRFVINTHASPYLATAGSGDVLAGIITGLATQSMDLFDACCAGVWIHGDAAIQHGIGLVASDLPDLLPQTLHRLFISYDCARQP